MTSLFLSVAKAHFSTTSKAYEQPHTIALQLQFLRRSWNGAAVFTVSDLKLGRRTSTIHIALTQEEHEQQPLVVGYLTQSNLDTEVGMSLDTAFALHPPPPPLSSIEALHQGSDPNWILSKKKYSKFRKAGSHVKTYLPRNGQVGQALIDQWLRFENGDPFTQEAIGYLADTFPQIMESANGQEDLEKEMQQLRTGPTSRDAALHTVNVPERSGAGLKRSQWAQFWYPTVLLNLDIKKVLPPEGIQWLFSRVRAKRIRNGRMDLEVIIMDDGGDIVALSTHTALIVDAERNMARKSTTRNNFQLNGSKI